MEYRRLLKSNTEKSNDNKSAQLASRLGVSRSAISKAVNHCAGLGSEVRETILSAAEAEGVVGKPFSDCEVYVILPESPSFFWGELYRELSSALGNYGFRMKFNIYSKIGDRATVDRYLDEAVRLCAKVIIIAARHPELDERLTELADGRLVISVCEATEAANVFFFGSDRVADGRLLAEICIEKYPNAKRILLIGEDSERIRGFCGFCAQKQIFTLEPGLSFSPSELARSIDAIHRQSGIELVISLEGFSATVCMALKKCRLDLPCFGFERQPIEVRYGQPRGEVCQSLSVIAGAAAEAAGRYLDSAVFPSGKYNYFASEYRSR